MGTGFRGAPGLFRVGERTGFLMRNRGIAAGLLVVLLTFPSVAAAQQDAFSLDGLVVTTSPTPRAAAAVASHVTVLDGADLRERGFTSVADALRDVSGVNVAMGGSFGSVTSVFLRGGESDYTLVLVDGVQVNQPGGSFDFASLTTDDVERIEIVRGPSSALYGSDAVSGVIQIITRTGRGPLSASGRVETGSYSEPRGDVVDGVRWSTAVAGGGPRSSYGVSLARDVTDGLLAFNNRSLNTVLSGSARLLPDERTRVDLTLRVADRRYHFPTDGAGLVVDRNAFTYTDETLAHVGLARTVSRRLTLEALLGMSETDGGTDDAQDDPADTLGFYASNSLDHFRRATAELRAHVSLGAATLTGGWEVEQEHQRSATESMSEFGPSSGRSESSRFNRAVFVHARGQGEGVAFTAGGRLEDNERFGTQATWEAGLSGVLPGLGARLRGSVGTAIKEPTFYENYATGFARGNPELDPERSIEWEVGLERELLDGAAAVRATYFRQRFQDLIQYTSAPPSPTDPNFFNVAAARASGVETELDVDAGPVRAGASWTWLHTEVTDAGFDSGSGAAFVKGEPLLRRPSESLAMHATARLGEGSHVDTRLSFEGSRDDRDFTTFPATPVELRRYALWSVGGAWRVLPALARRPDVTLSVRAENLLDQRYHEVYGFPAPGRQLYVGLAVGVGEPSR